MKRYFVFSLVLFASLCSKGQDFYNAKFSIGPNNGWYKLATFDLTSNTGCCNSVNVDFKVHHVNPDYYFDIDGNIRFRQHKPSKDVAEWSYQQRNRSGEFLKFKKLSSFVYELWGNSPINYGHFSIELSVTKETGLFTITTYNSHSFVTDGGQPDVNLKGDYYFPHSNVGIGTTAPDSKLTVKGTIHAEEVKVDLSVPGPDYVFEEGYPLPPLEETKVYIDQHKHLPGIPSSAEMQQNGVNLLEMNMKLLEKVEELVLYQLQLLQKIEAQNQRIYRLENKEQLRPENK